jgi:hypothetical protein
MNMHPLEMEITEEKLRGKNNEEHNQRGEMKGTKRGQMKGTKRGQMKGTKRGTRNA